MEVLRKKRVSEKTGLSEPTIDRLEAEDEFPKRIQLGSNSVGWIEQEIDDWILSRQRGVLPMPGPFKQGRAA